jgi:hypothetical protein
VRLGPIAASAATILGVTCVAATTHSPFHPSLPADSQAVEPLRSATRILHLEALGASSLAVVGVIAVVLALLAFGLALYEAWQGRLSWPVVVGFAIAYHCLVLGVPLLFANDVHNYSMYGRMVSVHHANPYVATPQDFSGDRPFFDLIDPMWQNAPSVYGPVFTLLSGGLARVFNTPSGMILAFKLIAAVASVGMLLVVVSLARRLWPERAAFAAVLIGWNPLVLFHAVGGGHNDLLVGLAIAGALLLAVNRHELLATAALTVGMLIKLSAGLPLLLLLVFFVARRWHQPQRWRVASSHLLVIGGLSVVAALPFLQWGHPTLGLLNTPPEQRLAPSAFVGRASEAFVRELTRSNQLVSLAGSLGRLLFYALFLCAITVLVWRVVHLSATERPFQGLAEVWGWALLFLILTAPALLPWYVIWVLPVAWLLPLAPRLATVGLSAVLMLWEIPADERYFPSGVFTTIRYLTAHMATLAALGALLWLVIDLSRRTRFREVAMAR